MKVTPINPPLSPQEMSFMKVQLALKGLVCGHHCFPSVQIEWDVYWLQTLVISTFCISTTETAALLRSPARSWKPFPSGAARPQNKTCIVIKMLWRLKEIHKEALMLFCYMLHGIPRARWETTRHGEGCEWNGNKAPLRCFLTRSLRPRWMWKWCSF